jgi:hypothetical protein
MAISTIKFSQFIIGTIGDPTNIPVGLGDGVNIQVPYNFWTTSTRPASPYNGLLGYNTQTFLYEYWDANANAWVQLGTSGDVLPGLQNELGWYATTGSEISGLTTSDNGVLITSPSGVPGWLANGTPGYVLTANSGAPPSWQVVSASGAITRIDGNTGSVTPTAGVITISGGTTGITTSGTGSTLTFLLTNYLEAPLGIKDANGNIVVSCGSISGAVNYIGLSNNSTGAPPVLAAAGSDSSVNLAIQTKSGNILLQDSSAVIAPAFQWYEASGSNYSGLKAPSSPTNVVWSLPETDGSDGSILQTNGSAALSFSTATYPSTTTINQILYSSAANVISGLATLDNGVLITSASGAPELLANGTAGYVLTANSGAPPSWQSAGASGAITTIDGDSGSATPSSGVITISGGSTGLTTSGSSHTLSLTGTLNLGSGGTNASLTASNGGIFYSTGSAGAILAGTATAHQVLLSGASTSPIWSTATYPVTTTINQLLYSSSSNVIAGLTTANSSVLITSSGGVPSLSTTLPAGLTIPGYQTTITPSALTEVNDTNVTLTLGGAPSTALLQAVSLTLGWTGDLAISRGGTGVGSVTTAPTATAWAGWDGNENLSANNFLPNYATTATAAATTTLTVTSAYAQFFTGTTTQSVVLPVTNTLVLGFPFYIVNNSTGVVTIKSSGGNTIQAMASGTNAYLTCILTTGTTAASWNCEYAFNGGSGSGTVNTGTQYQLAYYAANGTAVSGLTGVNSAGLTTTSGGVPTWVAYTGSGAPVLATGPTLVDPTIGAAVYSSLQNASNGQGLLDNTGANALLIETSGGTSVNYVNLTTAATGNPPALSANGSDTNIPLKLFGKGTGGVEVQGSTAGGAAPSGYVGEIISSVIASGSAIGLTSGSAANVTSISLTAGDWDVYGNVYVAGSAINFVQAWCSLSSATPPDNSLTNIATATAVGQQGINTPFFSDSVSSTTTVYLSVKANFSSTATACGGIYARRRR